MDEATCEVCIIQSEVCIRYCTYDNCFTKRSILFVHVPYIIFHLSLTAMFGISSTQQRSLILKAVSSAAYVSILLFNS